MKKIFFLFLLLVLSGCAVTQPPQTSPLTISDPKSTSSTEATSTPPHAVSIQSLIEKQYNGSHLTLVRVLEDNTVYTRHFITYTSGDLIISGIMNIPKANRPEGGFPILILNHGHIDTSLYTNGRGLKREQDYLARQGYVVLHPDYRNHAQSGKDNRDVLAVRLAYAEDVINAVYAVKNSNLDILNKEKIGMLGHSMGGGITLATLVAQPDLVKAAVLYAPVSGDMQKSYDRWMSRRPEDIAEITQLYGSPTTSPEFWKNVSSENFYSRITAPIAIFHGTADRDVPLDWSEQTKNLLQKEGKKVFLTIYASAPHEFSSDWGNFMQSVKIFFDDNLKK